MRQAINGIPPPVEHDPIVRLPALEMDIPRAWLGQQGMLKFMESLSDLKLQNEEKSGNIERIPEENDTEKERRETKGEGKKKDGNRKM